MSFEPYYMLRETPRRSEVFEELDDIALTEPALTRDGDTIPAGAEGTVVAVWREGEVYEVEFAEPAGALCRVRPDRMRFLRRLER